MMKRNHLLAAATAVGVAAGLAHWPVSVVGLAIGVPTSLLNDLDTPMSTLGRRAGPVPYLIRLLGIRHRTVLHSALFVALVTSGILFWGTVHHWAYVRLVAVSVGAGLLSHPLADAFTEHGVPLFWPVPYRVRLARIRVDSPFERIAVTAGLLALAFGVLTWVGTHNGWAWL